MSILRRKKPSAPPPRGISAEQVCDIVLTTFRHREQKITDNAAREAADVAVTRVIEYLQSVGVLDEGGAPKPGQRLKVRIVNPKCYPPLVLQ